jgi:DNA-binding response OmpR family regulator
MERRVLVVDDSEACGATVEVALENSPGLRVVRLTSGERAWEALSGEGAPYAAVVTDLELESHTGFELIRLARARSQTMAIIAVSGTPDRDAGKRALEAGANAFFAKPFSPVALRAKLEVLLG